MLHVPYGAHATGAKIVRHQRRVHHDLPVRVQGAAVRAIEVALALQVANCPLDRVQRATAFDQLAVRRHSGVLYLRFPSPPPLS